MSTYKTGEEVFFRHPEHSWVCGVVKSCGEGVIICTTSDNVRSDIQQNEEVNVSNLDDIEPLHMDALNDVSDDLLDLTVLHEAVLLRCLYLRYMSDMVYTNIGAIMIALNPFTTTIQRYQDSQLKNYLSAGRNLDKSSFPPDLVPHSWAQAHIAYHEMIDTRRNQCIIVSGESGSGKTETTKMVLKYSGLISAANGCEKDKEAALCAVERFLASSSILECFGNAKTVNNDNSSRFGKFVKVKFNSRGLVVGAKTNKYMLEKSRIVSAAKGERLYHSFYLLAKGCMSQELGLEKIQHYVSLSSGDTIENSKYNTENDFDHVCTSMRNIGMKADEIKSVWHVTAAVMTLMNIRFISQRGACNVDIETLPYLKKVIKMLDIDEEKIIHEFVTSTKQLPGNKFVEKPNDVATAMDIRNATCRHLYDGLFTWIVERCNSLCDIDSDENWIGLLDIFGFEDLRANSFEQLCINLTNEYLQYNYNMEVFERDIEECKKEGVDMTAVKFLDNTGCLKLLTSQGGIFPLLDECCSQGCTDPMFLDKVVDNHSNNVFFKRDCVTQNTFCVRHYAGDVTYNIDGWIEKNRDTLKDAVRLIVRSSGDPLVAACLPAPLAISEHQDGEVSTVGGLFCNQLTSLMDLITSTNPHWIRCIKPHPAKKPKMFHGKLTMNQLEASGVLDTVKIRKAGYSIRISKDIFYRRYRACSNLDSNEVEVILDILKAAQVRIPFDAQVARTKVFMKSHVYIALERLRNVHLLETCVTLQRVMRGFLGRHELFRVYMTRGTTDPLPSRSWEAKDDVRSQETGARQEVVLEKEKESIMSQCEHKRQNKGEEVSGVGRDQRHSVDKEESGNEEERRSLKDPRQPAQSRNRAAVCIQRYVRGGLTRLKLYRCLLEEHRAVWEHEREIACEQERHKNHMLDRQRSADEKAWVQYLRSVDHLKRMKALDNKRVRENALQKIRILFRELQRQEDMQRLKVVFAEKESRSICTAHWQSLAEEMLKNERSRRLRVEQLEAKNRKTSSTSQMLHPKEARRKRGIEARAERSAAADTRVKEALTEYALSRARLHDSQHNSQRLMPAGTRRPSSPNSSLAEKSLFGEVQRRWLRQQELMDLALVPNVQARSRSATSEVDDGQYNGPHRAMESSVHSIPSMFQSSLQPFSLARSTAEVRENAKQTSQWTPLSRGTIDWDSAFNS